MPTIKVRDINLHYTERGDGPPVVALHAATVSSRELGWLSQAIVHEGYNVISPDLRGHGETPNPAPDLHLTRLVDDILEFVYLLGRTPIHAMGYSLGGAIALYGAQRQPDLFRSLVLLGTNYHAPSPGRLERVLGPAEQRPADQRTVFDPQSGVVVGWDKHPDEFRTITCPTLIITGDRDEFYAVEDNVMLYRTLPNAEILVIPHADHLRLVRHPMVFRALLDFYGRVPR